MSQSTVSGPNPEVRIRKLLECPGCFSIPTPYTPIYNCLQGHSICSRCRRKHDRCMTCQCTWTFARNFTLEAIAAEVSQSLEQVFPTSAVILGNEDFLTNDLGSTTRQIDCHLGKLDGCNDSSVDVENFLPHLLKVHGVLQCQKKSGTFALIHILRGADFADVTWRGKYLEFDGKQFLTRSFLHLGYFHFTLALIGDESDVKNYNVKVKLKNRDSSKQAPVEATTSVCPVRMSNFDIMESGFHGIAYKSLLQRLCTEPTVDGMDKVRWEIVYELKKVNT